MGQALPPLRHNFTAGLLAERRLCVVHRGNHFLQCVMALREHKRPVEPAGMGAARRGGARLPMEHLAYAEP